MAATKVIMCLIKYNFLILFAFFLSSNALNCKTDGGPKYEELKTIYTNCLKRPNGKNSSRGYPDDDWREPRGHKQNSQWDRDSKMGSKDERQGRRDDRMDDRLSSRDDRTGIEDRLSNRDDRMDMDAMGSYGLSNRDNVGRRDDRMSRDDRMNRDDRMGRDGFGRSQISGRDDFQQSAEFGSQMSPSQYDGYRSSMPIPRRFRREKQTATNSGQRSQYNPNFLTQRPFDVSNGNDERNSYSNHNHTSKKEDNKGCALHCFLENLEMTGDNGMPDRYLVTHAITKDVKNEDLRDFLQESVEECFQILDNENTEDKCEFSKNLMMCLSEKGRANCDDWKDVQF